MFGIVDRDASDDESAPVPAKTGEFVSIGRSSILLGSLQSGLDVSLRLESWSAAPPPLPPEDWADRAEGACYSRAGCCGWISSPEGGVMLRALDLQAQDSTGCRSVGTTDGK
jgi:hypothetical protein